MMKANHPDDPAAFAKLLTKIPDLRTLNTLHSEKLLGLTVPVSVSNGEARCPRRMSEEMVDEKPPRLPPPVEVPATSNHCPFPR